MLRDWTDSETMNSLSIHAERFFVRLIMRADDYGCFTGNPLLIRSYLFPYNPEITQAEIGDWVGECVQRGLLKAYAVDEKAYIQIIDFGQRLRSKKSKYPLPDDAQGDAPRAKDKSGYVYLIGENSDGPVKIGFSLNPWARVKELNTGSHSKLQVIVAFHAPKSFETELHKAFDEYQMNSEWFNLPKTKIILFINACKYDDTVAELRKVVVELRNTVGNVVPPELEVEYEEETEEEHEDARVTVWPSFDDFWTKYAKKVDRIKCEKIWKKIPQGAREKIMEHLERYVRSTPEIQFRKDPATYLRNKSWENEIIPKANEHPAKITVDQRNALIRAGVA